MTLILVDTSIWIEHLRHSSSVLSDLLHSGLALAHPMVIGELALGNLAQRKEVLSSLNALPKAATAMDLEVLAYIDRRRLHGRGIGYVDAHLLVSVQLTAGTKLWTRDRRLGDMANEAGVAFTP